MPSFAKGPTPANYEPFGQNEFLRSTRDVKTEGFTVAASTVTVEVINGTNQKILQAGEVLAKITSGTESGKVGPFQAGVTDGRQTLSNVVGINSTFLPWQLLEHDESVAAVVEARVVQAWCFERDAAGARITLTNTTAAQLVAGKSASILFS